ncbi:bacteriophage replication gene A protein [Nitrosomonas aestuarii]|nr:bacteriophage replication gene A protein [Nitrosomonas aestuarii]
MWHKFDTNLTQVVQADELTANFGTPDCRQFRRHVFSVLSPIAGDLALRYAKISEQHNYEQANHELEKIHDSLCINDLNLCAGGDELFNAAKKSAKKCTNARERAKTVEEAYQACARIVQHYRIKPPEWKAEKPEPALNRMCCPIWWHRKIQVLRLRTIETISRNIELVTRYRSAYASDYAVNIKRKQKEKNRQYLESTFISNEVGEQFSLQELSDRSVSNPAIRRAELMVRVKGFEMVANHLGHVGEFYTLTTPSRMHASLHSGKTNPRYDGTTPLQAHEYLTHLWALIRAELHRREIRPYGFRVVEPHHDGTPHWHFLFFMPEEHCKTVREVMQYYALLDNGSEPGALKHRFKAEAIDPQKGSAVGYIAKYIAKNIDGHALEQDLYGNDAQTAAERITAWANIWGIRQFQQIGGPSVTVWRQLRKLNHTDDKELESIRKFATASDWAAFMLVMRGPTLPVRQHPIKPLYDHSRTLNPETGEIISVQHNRYKDEAAKRVAGVVFNGKNFDARMHFWMVLTGNSEDVTSRGEARAAPASCHAAAVNLGPVSITVPDTIHHEKSAYESKIIH